MKISTFIHEGENGALEMLAEDLILQGHEVISAKKCLCMSENSITKDGLGDITLIHPGEFTSCYDGIRSVVSQFPEHKFYVFAFQDECRKFPRVAGIGKYLNVSYILNSQDLIDLWTVLK